MTADQDASEEAARARRAKAWTRIVRPGDDIDIEAEDEAYWLQYSPAERFLLTAQLSEEVWEWYLAGRKARE